MYNKIAKFIINKPENMNSNLVVMEVKAKIGKKVLYNLEIF